MEVLLTGKQCWMRLLLQFMICLSVGWLVITVIPAKMAELIKIWLGTKTPVGWWNDLCGSIDASRCCYYCCCSRCVLILGHSYLTVRSNGPRVGCGA